MHLPHSSQGGLSKTQTWSNCLHGKIHCKLPIALQMLYWFLFMLDNVLNQLSPSFIFCHVPSFRTAFSFSIIPCPSVSLGFVNAVLYPQRSFAMDHTTLDLSIQIRYSVITSPSKPIWPSESIIFTILWANHDHSPYYSNFSLSPLSFWEQKLLSPFPLFLLFLAQLYWENFALNNCWWWW